MAPSPSRRPVRQRGDRLSALPDKALEHILSHLMSDEAARSSVLSRRWRRVHEGVPVVRLVDGKSGDRYSRRGISDLSVCFDHQVSSTIIGKAAATPIRTFSVTAVHPPYDLLDQWIVTSVTSGVEDLDVKLRYYEDSMKTLCPSIRCPYTGRKNSADFDKHEMNRYTKTQPHIFGCHTLRRLRLANWKLHLPAGNIVMESLETLCLARIMDPHGQLQQLISSCNCLANLTLEECPSITEIAVTNTRLRTFTMICCHNATSVELHSAYLQSLHYKGNLPPRGSPFFAPANYEGVKAVSIEICEKLSTKEAKDVAPVAELISQCTKLAYLHLSLRPSMAYYSSMFTSVLRKLDSLTHLSLQGCLPTDHTVRSVSALLVNTKHLETLSLFPLGPEPPKKKMKRYRAHDDTESDSSDTEPEEDTTTTIIPDDAVVKSSSRMPKSIWRTYIGCLEYSLRRINIGNYQGRPLEKMLARFLLSRAAALEEISVTLAAGEHKDDEVAKELRSWRWNRRTRVTCN